MVTENSPSKVLIETRFCCHDWDREAAAAAAAAAAAELPLANAPDVTILVVVVREGAV